MVEAAVTRYALPGRGSWYPNFDELRWSTTDGVLSCVVCEQRTGLAFASVVSPYNQLLCGLSLADGLESNGSRRRLGSLTFGSS